MGLTVEDNLGGRLTTSSDMLTVSSADCHAVDCLISSTEDSSPTLCFSIRVGEVFDDRGCIFDGDVPARLHVASRSMIQDGLLYERNERETGPKAKVTSRALALLGCKKKQEEVVGVT